MRATVRRRQGWILGIGVVLGACALAVLAAWFWSAAPQPTVAAIPSQDPPAPSTVERARQVAGPSPSPTTPESAPPLEPHEEALMAVVRESSQGWVRCALPESLIGDLNTEDLPFATEHDGVLSMAIDNKNGGKFAWLESGGEPSKQVGIATWDGVGAGERVDCRVYTKTVEVEVHVRNVDGSAAAKAWVGTSRGGRMVGTDEDGVAIVELYKGLPTMLNANEASAPGRAVETAMMYGGTMVDAPGSSERVDVVMDIGGKSRTLSDSEVAVRMIEKADHALSGADAVSLALKQPGLSDAARDVLREWRTDLESGAEDQLDDAEKIAADADGDPYSYSVPER